MKLLGTGVPLFGVAGVSAGLLLAVLWTTSGDALVRPQALHAETADTAAPAAVRNAPVAPAAATDARTDWSNVERAPDAAPLSIAAYER
jgi:hypothetical protein